MQQLINRTLKRLIIVQLLRPLSSKSELKPVKELPAEKFRKLRLENIKRLKSIAAIGPKSPFPNDYRSTITVKDFVNKYANLKPGENLPDECVRLAGRIHGVREMSKKLIFYDLKHNSCEVQVMACANLYATNPENFHDVVTNIRRGDFIGIYGFPQRTKTGELSIVPKELRPLLPSLQMWPSDRFGLKDQESRYRQRYLDWTFNNRTRNVILTKIEIEEFIEQFLKDKDFLKVRTPIVTKNASGANAKPFRTYSEEFGDLVNRISPELNLKMFLIGDFDRVYEIGPSFRNEGIDLTHYPEFTTVEGYMAFSDYYEMMELIEQMLSQLVLKLFGSYTIKYHPDGPDTENVIEINFEPPYKRIDMMPELERALGVKLPEATKLGDPDSLKFLSDLCSKHNLKCSEPKTASKLIDKLVGKFIEVKCNNPTFIMNHPQIMSPLAKYHRDRFGISERFELFIAKLELCNGYTELNDPIVQRELFEQQAAAKAQGDDEAQSIDEDYLTALEYGLPPCSGFGIGIERLTMLLTDLNNIKEVLTYTLVGQSNRHRKTSST